MFRSNAEPRLPPQKSAITVQTSEDMLVRAGKKFHLHIPTDYTPSTSEFRNAMIYALRELGIEPEY